MTTSTCNFLLLILLLGQLVNCNFDALSTRASSGLEDYHLIGYPPFEYIDLSTGNGIENVHLIPTNSLEDGFDFSDFVFPVNITFPLEIAFSVQEWTSSISTQMTSSGSAM